MVFPLTNLVILFVLVIGTAANIQKLFDSCTENADCGKNAICRDFYQGCAQKGCACDEGFYRLTPHDCIKVVKEGEACPDGECPTGLKCSYGVNPKCYPLISFGESCPQDSRSCPILSSCIGGKCECQEGFTGNGTWCRANLHNADCGGTSSCYKNTGLKCINAKCQCESGFRWMDYTKWQKAGACIKIPGDNCTDDSDCIFEDRQKVNVMVCSKTSKCTCDPVNYPIYVPEIQSCAKKGSLILNDIGDENCIVFNQMKKFRSCNGNKDLTCTICPEGYSKCVLLNKSDYSEATRQYVPVFIMIWSSLLTLQVL